MQELSRVWTHPMVRAGLALTGLGLCALGVTRLALQQRLPPHRCPAGMAPAGERCCGAGQSADHGGCEGVAKSCSSAQERGADGQCVARFGVVGLPGGELLIGAADWDGAGSAERFPRTHVAPFRIDVSEVTQERYRACPSCAAGPGAPGAPVSNVTPEQAERFCRSQGGRLPTPGEWVFAAAGAAARRYPWGNSGLVCRRAAFGLEQGPCAKLGGPELSGSRPDGASPEGVQDLAGNVAEWACEAAGECTARGGSFRSASAAELKSWAALPNRGKSPDIGFRCAYSP